MVVNECINIIKKSRNNCSDSPSKVAVNCTNITFDRVMIE